MILRHPGYDRAIVVCNALGTDGSLFLLALGAFGCCIFAMAATTSLAHLKGVIWRKIFGTSFNRASADRWVGGSGSGRGGLKVDVIWVVAHPDAGWATKRSGRVAQQPRRYSPLRSYNYQLAAQISAKFGNLLCNHSAAHRLSRLSLCS